MLLIIDNYDSFTYNLAQYLGELGQEVRVERNDQIGVDQALTLEPSAIVISPGPCTPNEAGVSLDLIRAAAGKVPLLGVCLGHQAIAQTFGASIVRAESVMHGKTSKVFHDEKGVFDGLPNPLEATRYHSLVVQRGTMPAELEVTAKTWGDEIMGVRHRTYAGTSTPMVGVQFHPESIMTREGMELLSNFLLMAGLPCRREVA